MQTTILPLGNSNQTGDTCPKSCVVGIIQPGAHRMVVSKCLSSAEMKNTY